MAGNLFISNSSMNNSSQYILFVKKLLVLVLILFATDRLIGMLLEKTFYQQKRGDAQNTIHLVEEANEDLIIMGSSRASHHYRSDILEKETGLTTFNGGRDEMVITYIYATLSSDQNSFTINATSYEGYHYQGGGNFSNDTIYAGYTVTIGSSFTSCTGVWVKD